MRRLEIERSLAFAIEQLGALPRGEARVPCGALRPGELAVALVEGWRGEIVHVALTDASGAVRRHKIIDPSFHNWAALALAMPGNADLRLPALQQELQPLLRGHDL